MYNKDILDTELLLACKDEFHRRLQIYQQWKKLNESSRSEWQMNRVPMAVLASSKMLTVFPLGSPPFLNFFDRSKTADLFTASANVKTGSLYKRIVVCSWLRLD